MATVVAIVAAMPVLVSMTNTEPPTDIRSTRDGIAISPGIARPHPMPSGGPVLNKRRALRCPQHGPTILAAGFSSEHVETVDSIIWRESRCLSHVINTTLNRDKSHDYGLTQINGRSWCERTRYYPDGYLQTVGVLDTCRDLLNPLTNLKAAYAIFTYSKGFSAWGK